ncbi:unnamed protein product [Angiostrongylus costaricensis]|uniref:Metalloendopeptidase n=1 Tax=Angiostrongylus costaricensis TaxID=334426 RepID=A0A0R3PXT0_ANGCS|nr:unnamed protein product [Angiostrongylus costaricensis]
MKIIVFLAANIAVTYFDIINVNSDSKDLFSEAQDVQKTNFRRLKVGKAVNNIVQKAFKMGVKVWSDATCIDFVEDKNAKDKVVVVKEDGSWSELGRIGGDQRLSLGDRATVREIQINSFKEGSAVHEIGHVLGLLHTMQRYDRDNYVRIFTQNIYPNLVVQFNKLSRDLTYVFGLAYDYGSIMHYDEISCSINKQRTMVAIDPFYQKTMGSDLISFSDVFMINKHYECDGQVQEF